LGDGIAFRLSEVRAAEILTVLATPTSIRIWDSTGSLIGHVLRGSLLDVIPSAPEPHVARAW
jgi:hypothetical protein